MKGLSDSGKKAIEDNVETLFEKLAADMLGYIPGRKDKRIVFTTQKPSVTLTDLFLQGMRNQRPNEVDKDTLKGMIRNAYNYITGLRDRTKSNVVSEIDGVLRQNHAKGIKTEQEDLLKVINGQLDKAKADLVKIADTEGTRVRNTGSAMDILKVGASLGQTDPYVFFITKKDSHTCKFCINNHHIEDKVTPKIFKFSEVRHSYLSYEDRKNGEVSLCGAHNFCRCSLNYLSPGFGFKNGSLTWIGLGHDEYAKQRGIQTEGAK